jgi:hypothetical protein
MSPSRHAAPMFVDIDNQAQTLSPVRLGQTPDEDSYRREAFIQNLVHDHPALVPMAEIEPAFSPLISVCKELPTPAGFLDNLWITPWGGLVLGEAKLVRNPQARREVVAQALDYARAVANWTFDDLEAAVRVALKQPAFRLWSLVENETDLGEDQFVDAVQRRLRTGQLLLLIIGDGIQEGVEALTAHLQLHAGLHVGLALLDLSLWRSVDGGLIVVPRVPMRTVLIERGIVRVEAEHARIDPPAATSSRTVYAPAKATTASEAEFYDHLATKRPELVEPLRHFLSEVEQAGVRPEIGRTVRLLLAPTPEISATAGYIESNGKLWFQGAAAAATRLGRPDAGENYLRSVAAIIGGQVRRYDKSAPEVVDLAGRGSDLATLLARQEEFKHAIATLVTELSG